MNDQHTKVYNTDKNGKNRLRFASAKKRSRQATADVYRRYKRRVGVVTSATSREQDVHHPEANVSVKRRKKEKASTQSQQEPFSDSDSDKEQEFSDLSNFASELDIALDRNGSEIFALFHRDLWPLVRSLPEVLHNSEKIVDLLLLHMLSSEDKPGEPTPAESDAMEDDVASDEEDDDSNSYSEGDDEIEENKESKINEATTSTSDRRAFVVNHATTDILHLIAVLARDLRYEIHPYVHSKIIPRILTDLLNPPLPPADSGKQPIVIDVAVVEAAFRTLSYIFRYDSEPLLTENDDNSKEPCLEQMRQYYGITLANRRELIRRLAAESFAPLIRKLKSDAAKKRHLRRVLKALAASATAKPTASALRMQQDASDGIAQLLFEVARGVSGRLHSKADSVVIKCLLDSLQGDFVKSAPAHDLLRGLATACFERLCRHLKPPNIATLLSSTIGTINRTLKKTSKKTTSNDGLSNLLKVAEQLVSFRDGICLKENETVFDEIEELLKELVDNTRFAAFDTSTRAAVLDLFCTTAICLQEDDDFLTRVAKNIFAILTAPSEDTSELMPVFVVMQRLMPQLPIQAAMNIFGSIIILAASEIVGKEVDTAVNILYMLSSVKCKNDSAANDVDDDSDELFFLDNAAACSVSDKENDELLSKVMCIFDNKIESEEQISDLAARSQVIAFIALAGGDDTDHKRLVSNYKKVSAWFLRLMKHIGDDKNYSSSRGDKTPIVVLMSIVIECFGRLSKLFFEVCHSEKVIASKLESALPLVNQHLTSNSDFICVVKSVSAFVAALKAVDIPLNDSPNETFDLLIPKLRDFSHFRRLHALEILKSFPARPYVVDHAALDHSDDLDEEADEAQAPVGWKNSSKGPTGICRLMDTLFQIELTPIDFKKERFILQKISRVEVLGRTGKLPLLYAEAAAAHMLGILHVKFAPVWNGAVKALIGLTKGHENCVWPNLHKQLTHRMDIFPYQTVSEDNGLHTSKDLSCNPKDQFSLYVKLESSKGHYLALFSDDVAAAIEQGRVSRHLNADNEVILESLWSVVEGAPTLMTSYSRSLVPIFLHFMRFQYYAAHPEEPDAQEMDLEDFLCSESYTKPDENSPLNARVVQSRLICLLKVFRAVNGPQQLFKHNVLLPIFVSHAGHQDTQTAQVAFDCILKFKIPYLVPYVENLKDFYSKGKLRSAMMDFKSSVQSGAIDRAHLKDLQTMLSRILFGRLSARATLSKASKDSPSARRVAVLAFLSSICEDDGDLYPFLYFMMRVYVPPKFKRKPIESQSSGDQALFLRSMSEINPEQCLEIPYQVHQGFLNVLEAVVSQFGHRVIGYVPSFMAIVLALCKAYEVKDAKPGDNEDPHLKENGDSLVEGKSIRLGLIRSLCYRRLDDLVSKFSDKIDFSEYSKRLWDTLRKSLQLLPAMVVKSETVPSLLQLLRALSRKPSLVPILKENTEAVPAVLKCLSSSSRAPVIDATLEFIDNLISQGLEVSQNKTIGQTLIQEHIDLLLEQFRLRLGSTAYENLGRRRPRKKNNQPPSTLRRELAILCSVSSIISERVEVKSTSDTSDNVESLCSLLIPFLDLGSGISDNDRVNILELLSKLVQRVSEKTAGAYYFAFSRFLGPYKSKAGIVAKNVRTLLATSIKRLSISSYPPGVPIANVLVDLSATNEKRVDEMDYDKVIGALNNLCSSSDATWTKLCKIGDCIEPENLAPIIQTCYHLLFNNDGVVSRGALKALKLLIQTSAEKSELSDEASEASDLSSDSQKWRKLLESKIIPTLRLGVTTHDTNARRFFILLFREVAASCKHGRSPHLHGDLSCLVRDEEPDLDFFINVTHVQVHRRARALNRLRKILVSDKTDASACPLTQHSLSNILIPIVTHPIYESKLNLEESFALEAIATVGAISRLMSWNKYHSMLWNHLKQFDRNPEQEKYLVGLICAIIDGFHFKIQSDKETTEKTSVRRALEQRIIPKIQSLLTKEKVDNKGKKLKMLRSSVVLALLKLFNKFPTDLFRAKLPRLLTVICDALTNRDSNARDIARITLAKMVVEMDLVYLADVLRDLAVSLSEGFKLHVRSATIHTILLELSSTQKSWRNLQEENSAMSPFDQAIPAFMDLLQQDIFGAAQERKDAQDNQVRHVKEAGGTKTLSSLELMASMIMFKPSAVIGDLNNVAGVSSIHAIALPLLGRLQSPDISMKSVRRIKECLSRVAAGLLRNPTVDAGEVFPFVQSTLESFVSSDEIRSFMATIENDSDDEDDTVRPIHVSGKKKESLAEKEKQEIGGDVVEWRPSTLKAPKTAKAARYIKLRQSKEFGRILDGASAPKLTGSSRYKLSNLNALKSLNDPSIASAVGFGLQVLSTVLKRSAKFVTSNDVLDPFVPLLTTCVCRCRDSDVMLLSMRCLGSLLRTDLPSLKTCAEPLATKTLELLTSSGSNQEFLQTNFKMLTFLINFDSREKDSDRTIIASPTTEEHENALSKGRAIPLSAEQMQVLISFLEESLSDSEQHSSVVGLIRAIMSHRFVSAEFYDLMESVLEQAVKSSSSSSRDQFSKTFVNYFINYPLSKERIEQHLKQIVLNLSYEHADGRLSAVGLVGLLVNKLPKPMLEEHYHLFFLPLTLQLVNDDSDSCRKAVARCIGSLLEKLSTESLQSLFNFTDRWSQGETSLRQMSFQLYAIFVDVRIDFVKRDNVATGLLEKIHLALQEDTEEWQVIYFALLLAEKMSQEFADAIEVDSKLWTSTIAVMTRSHAWIRLASSRLLSRFLNDLPPETFAKANSKHFLVSCKGGMYQIAKNLCFQLGSSEEEQNDELTAIVIKSLAWIVQAMKAYPKLCFSEEEEDQDRDPVKWVMTRLCNIAKQKGTKRRQAIFKCFAAFATFCSDISFEYLELMLEPLHRSEAEAKNDTEGSSTFSARVGPNSIRISEEAQLAKEVLHLLEEKCHPQEAFVKAYAAVKTRARDKKAKRKLDVKTEAVVDPLAAARRRIEKQEREKKRRKRRVDDRRHGRGATAKRRHVD